MGEGRRKREGRRRLRASMVVGWRVFVRSCVGVEDEESVWFFVLYGRSPKRRSSVKKEGTGR